MFSVPMEVMVLEGDMPLDPLDSLLGLNFLDAYYEIRSKESRILFEATRQSRTPPDGMLGAVGGAMPLPTALSVGSTGSATPTGTGPEPTGTAPGIAPGAPFGPARSSSVR